MKPDGMLAYYGERLPTVEINNTFYQMPKVAVLESWVRSTLGAFASRSRLRGASRTWAPQGRHGRDSLAFLYKNLAALGDKARSGAVSAAAVSKKDLARLREFLALLPQGHGAAFEFRNETLVRGRRLRCPEETPGRRSAFRTGGQCSASSGGDGFLGYVRLRLETYSEATSSSGPAGLRGRRGAKSTSTSCTSPLHRLTRRG